MIQKTEQEIMLNWDSSEIPLVSICCTTFKHEKYIAQALDSFLMQETDFVYEIIVRDDCSPDGTIEIINSYVKKYPNIIKPIFEKENQYLNGKDGLSTIFNIVKGEYIALCEGDDYWISPLKLQKQIELFKSDNSLKGVHTKVLYVDGDNEKIGESDRVEKGFEIINYKYLAQRNTIHTCSFVFTRDVIDQDLYSLLQIAPVGDLVIFLKTSLAGNIGYVDELMSAYRRGVGVSKNWVDGTSHQNILDVYDVCNLKCKRIKHITNISKRYFHYKLSIVNIKKSAYLKAWYHYILMLFFTKDVINSKDFVVNKINFVTYIKTFFKLLPFTALLIKEK